MAYLQLSKKSKPDNPGKKYTIFKLDFGSSQVQCTNDTKFIFIVAISLSTMSSWNHRGKNRWPQSNSIKLDSRLEKTKILF